MTSFYSDLGDMVGKPYLQFYNIENLPLTNHFHSPGRFFAATELKTMLAHILLNYDIKLPGDGSRPANFWYEGQVFPNMTADILFRKRDS